MAESTATPVFLNEIADEKGVERRNFHKWVGKFAKDVQVFKARGKSNQESLAVSPADAQKLRSLRGKWNNGRSTTQVEGPGCFYAIQLVPDISQERIKFGYASSLDCRLQDHRCTCPDAKVLKTWKCDSKWEHSALAVVSTCANHVGGEVYDVSDPRILFLKLDTFFSLIAT